VGVIRCRDSELSAILPSELLFMRGNSDGAAREHTVDSEQINIHTISSYKDPPIFSNSCAARLKKYDLSHNIF